MKLSLSFFLLLNLFVLSADAQGIFDEKFDNCHCSDTCYYCGDTIAHYTKNLTEKIAWEINHSINNSRYELKNFDVMYEVIVDSAGRTCVVSDQSLGMSWSWLLKDDIRKWLNNMADWKPAVKNGAPINSLVILEAQFRGNFVTLHYTERPAPKTKKKKKKKE